MSPKLTRRNFLAGVAGLGATYWSARRLQRGAKDANFESWSPAAGTWPLPYYDAANTSHSPDASPPQEEPAVEFVAGGEPWVPLVGADYVALDSGPDAVLTRDYEVAWSTEQDVHEVAFGPPDEDRLYLGGDGEWTFAALSTRGDPRLEHRTASGPDVAGSLVPGREHVYLGDAYEVFEAGPDLSLGWRVPGRNVALADDRLYALKGDLSAYEERSGLGRRVESGPRRTWYTDVPSYAAYPPAVADGRVVVGTYGPPLGEGAVVAFDAATGERLWEPRKFGVDHRTPAVVGDRGYLATAFGETYGGAVVCLDLDTGETLWRDDTEWSPDATAVGGETLVVTGEAGDRTGMDPEGVLRAYTLEGERLWTHRMGAHPRPPALVEDKILFGAANSLCEAT